MADQKKWFKVWASILTDPHFLNLSLPDKGRWAILGALLCQQGTMGKLKIVGPAELVKTWFEVESVLDLRVALKRLPNVHLSEPLDAYGSFIVTMLNWRKYQVDSTIAERVTRLRRKRRGEEKLTSKSTSTSPPSRSRLTRGATEETPGNGEPTAEELENQEANKAWANTPVKPPESEMMTAAEAAAMFGNLKSKLKDIQRGGQT